MFIGLVCICLSAVLSTSVVAAQDTESLESKHTRKGADTCLKCHDEDYNNYPILPIFYGKHGNRDNPRSPMAQLQCEACHGPGRAHATEPKAGQKRAPIIVFGKESWVSKAQQNEMCMGCHNRSTHMNWVGSAHDNNDLLCVDCHRLHVKRDPIFARGSQSEVCYGCHKIQRAEFERNSVHPVRYGKMQCSQCHNPHGSFTEALLKTNTKNETCYVCHAEKRGPFLWAHAPVQEDCGLCHEHHGSMHTPLLKAKTPSMCQSCHSQSGHPSIALDSGRISGGSSSAFLQGKNCLNCHSQIHGSNHPSGVKFLR